MDYYFFISVFEDGKSNRFVTFWLCKESLDCPELLHFMCVLRFLCKSDTNLDVVFSLNKGKTK